MTLNIFRIILLTLFFIMASQGTFYLFSVSKAFSTISMEAFAEQRNAITVVIEARLKTVIFLSLGICIIILAISVKNGDYRILTVTGIAFICLLTDLFLAVKYNIPINSLFKDYIAGSADAKWENLRMTWLKYIEYRGVFQIAGFLSLLIGFIWRK